MAYVDNEGNIISAKSKKPNKKTNHIKTEFSINDNVWFIENLVLFEGKVTKVLPNNYYECYVKNKNKKFRDVLEQVAIVEERDLHHNKT